MPGEFFAQFMQLRGRRIIEFAGTLWYSANMRIYMNIPFHEPLDLPRVQLAEMMRKTHMLGVRYPSLHRAGLPSGAYVFRQKHYDLSSIHQKQRAHVRRGLEGCEVRQVDEAELLVQGLKCNLDTMERQNRFDSEFGNPRQWQRLVKAAWQCPAVRVFGAFADGRLAAYAIICREDGWIQILHQMSRTDSLNFFPNHALTYTLTKACAEDPSVEGVCYGLAGLSSGEGLHQYKLRFGYELQQQNSVFLFHPGVEKLLSSSLVAKGVGLLRKARPENQRFKRIESVLTGARMTRFGSAAVNLAPVSE
ncbi:MAG: hypothetical protein WAM39_28845 [Bryobacteraceae bacterium]